MSTVEIYEIHKNGDVTLSSEVKNSFQWGMLTWGAIEERYMEDYRPSFVPDNIPDSQVEEFLGYKPMRVTSPGNVGLREIWNMYNSNMLKPSDRWVLGSTFDNIIVLREDFDDLISAYRGFYPSPDDSNLHEVADIIEILKQNDEIIGVAWSISQISSPWYFGKEIDSSHPEWDEYNLNDKGECHIAVPYNIHKGDKHSVLTKEKVEKAGSHD